MAKARRFFLLHERRETWRARAGEHRRSYCDECRQETDWVTAAAAAVAAGLTEREVFRLVENGEAHFAESEDGVTFICLPSIRTKPARDPREE